MHDVMIYQKKNTPFMRSNAYTNCYEFMFILSKGSPAVFNPIKEKTVRHGEEMVVCNKKADGVNNKVKATLRKEKTKTNVWRYAVGLDGTTNDKIAFQHPAIFPRNWRKTMFCLGRIKGLWYLTRCAEAGQRGKWHISTGANISGWIFPTTT